MLTFSLCAILLWLRVPLSLYAQVTPGSETASRDAWRARLSADLDQYIDDLRPEPSPGKTSLLQVQWNPEPPREVKTARDGVPFASLLDAILRTHGLPGFVAVARVESGFNPQALSPKGHAPVAVDAGYHAALWARGRHKSG